MLIEDMLWIFRQSIEVGEQAGIQPGVNLQTALVRGRDGDREWIEIPPADLSIQLRAVPNAIDSRHRRDRGLERSGY
jgi:hypothetical protein